jgi:hypothetical protein
MRRALALAVLLPLAAAAQEDVSQGQGAVLRGLDKITGQVTDMEMTLGTSRAFGRLEVSLEDCRYPTGNPAGDAFAHVTVRPETGAEPVFAGWMIASSPALNALDHARYDVWVLRCTTS